MGFWFSEKSCNRRQAEKQGFIVSGRWSIDARVQNGKLHYPVKFLICKMTEPAKAPEMAHHKQDRNKKVDLTNRYALDRTALANERTYLAWTRTGLASLAGGLATEKYLEGVLPIYGLRFIATSLIIFSMLSFTISAWRYHTLHVDLDKSDVVMLPKSIVLGLSLFFSTCSLLALIGLWVVINSR
jgi:putative membrane protein